MIAHGAKSVFQIIVGSGKIRHIVAREKPCPIAISHLEKGCGHLPKWLRGICFLSHLIEQRLIVLLYFLSCVLVRIGEQVCSPMYPRIPCLDIGPQIGGCGQSFCQQTVQALKFRWQAPFCATRSREEAMRVSRSWSLSPEAVSGGCPSSVRALRTAKQYL